MKRLSRMLGVTLLEIMLVLAIAAMIIVMSIRYYQNATSAQQTNDLLQQILSITAAADNLSQANGTFSAATSTAVTNIVGSANLHTPWSGGTVGFTVSGSGSSFTIKANTLPLSVCTAIQAKINTGAGSHFKSVSGTCSGNSSTVTIVYGLVPN